MAQSEIPAGWEGILEDGETILWQGRPAPGLSLSEIFRGGTLMSLFVAGFGVFWTIMAATMMAESRSAPGAFRIFFPLFGVIFVIAALSGGIGPAIRRALRRSGTYYTLSDRAAYIAVASGGKRSLDRYPLDQMNAPSLEEGTLGGVFFSPEESIVRTGRSGGHRTVRSRVGFERIDDPRHVFGLLRDARDALRDAAGPGAGPE